MYSKYFTLQNVFEKLHTSLQTNQDILSLRCLAIFTSSRGVVEGHRPAEAPARTKQPAETKNRVNDTPLPAPGSGPGHSASETLPLQAVLALSLLLLSSAACVRKCPRALK
jgi:hypothetical protein